MEAAQGAIVVVHAHPYARRSRACAALLRAFEGLAGAQVRSLYERYPDFDIDVAAEQEALSKAALVVWLHPMRWYGPPALLALWFEKVLAEGWAYGDGGRALAGKDCLWVVTAGGDEAAFSPSGRHGRPFASFVPPVEQTARYCSMRWLEPHVLLGARVADAAAREASAAALRARLEAWRAGREVRP
jgi:glutathione-regulated potassium-efflux system ancillary protein KefF